MTRRVVVASDKFKGSLTAAQVADALEEGLRRGSALGGADELEIVRSPVADGGDGTLDAAVAAGFTRVPLTVAGPLGDPVETAWARSGRRAVVELADCSGLLRLPGPPTPASALAAHTYGTGEAVAAAVAAGCHDILLGVGGSCSTDGGAGLLAALGAWIGADETGAAAAPETARRCDRDASTLRRASRVDLTGVRASMTGVRLRVATDVDAPLLGRRGSATVFGPQKGAGADEVALLESELERWADTLDAAARRIDSPRALAGAGAAGGAAYGAVAGAGATLTSGVEAVLDLVGFDAVLDGADLVITGEGSLDEQSLQGKAPFGVLRAARARGIEVVAVCGRTTLTPASLAAAGFCATHTILSREPDVERAMADAASHLVALGERIAQAPPTPR